MTNKILLRFFWILVLSIAIVSCKQGDKIPKSDASLSVDFEKYELENGLDVVLHQDKSDPIVSVAIQYGVGSNREKTGRTGFAHLFEHMLFQESENIPQDQFFKNIYDAGGFLNGGTWQDGTIYYEVVPKNAMEMVLWMESDRMGYFINTVTESAFYNQQEVVQNEKRFNYDNRPYGHTNWVLDKNLYPEGHPYNWQVIGELVDLKNATIQDVHEFYDNYYGPNNATLVIAGDFEFEEAKLLIEKYFGEIKARKEVTPLEPQPVTLENTKRLYHEDNFAQAPQLNIVWPTTHQFTEDAYALDFLAEILSRGKKAPLYRVLVKEKELAAEPRAYSSAQEIAGDFRIRVTANSGVDLDAVEAGIFEAFALFEKEGVTDKDIERIKAGLETDFYNDISSILDKAFQLAQYNVFTGDPGFIVTDVENIRKVTKDDVMRVYNKYIKDKPFVLTSFVPKGQTELIAHNSEMAPVVEEEITENASKDIQDSRQELVKTDSNFDRSIQPEPGPIPTLTLPDSWTVTLSNGLKVYGIQQDEIPTVNFSVVIEGGHLLDSMEKNGIANLLSEIMMEGTANKTPEELEEAIAMLGANISMYTSNEAIKIRGNTLTRNFEETLKLVEEILLEPRWDQEELNRIKIATANRIKRASADPEVIVGNVFNKILYGDDHINSYPLIGTENSVASIAMEDLKNYYAENLSPSISSFHVVGKIDRETVLSALKSLEEKWEAKEITIPKYEIENTRDKASLYFVDVPNAKQSVINVGAIAVPRTHPDFYPLEVMNYKLGGGFSSSLMAVLREEKGYTYDARSRFSGGQVPGTFKASSSVRTNATGESVAIFREEIAKYREGISEEELEFTKNALIKSNALRFETQFALLGMLEERSAYDLPENYIEYEEAIIKNMTLEQHKELANKYLDESRMAYVVVGDATTQYAQFENMGFDDVMLVDKDAEEVELETVKQ